MRQGQQHNNNKRMRGRNRKGPNPLARSYESNGPDVKIRGTALHIAEKYIQLARDASSSGDRVAEQNYLQHAEHYYRIVAAAQAQMPQQPQMRQDEDDEEIMDERGGPYDRPSSQSGYGENRPQQNYGAPDPQPYNNNGNGFSGNRDAEGDDEDNDGDAGDRPQPVVTSGEQPGVQGQPSAPREGEGAPFRQRGRRSGRNRTRRPEGELAPAGEPARVPVTEE